MSTPSLQATHTRSRTGMVRVSLGLLIGTSGYILPFSAASTVLLPARIAAIDPDNKVRLLAILIGAAAVVALVRMSCSARCRTSPGPGSARGRRGSWAGRWAPRC